MTQNKETRQTPDFVPRIVPAEGSSQNIHRQVREDGICVLTFDRPGSSANIFDPATLAELRQEIDFIAGTPQLTGVILISAKPSIFIAGADLHRMTGLTPSSEIRELLELGQAQIHR
jgi:3-hydroxyacyl-CoA dehydrogenase/enoyl-CoA hydratase/3-hydroxybutyryl-CoA epimerase